MAARTRDAAPRTGVRSDAYVGLLLLALLAQIAGAVFLYLDWSANSSSPPKIQDRPRSAPLAAPPAPPRGGPQGPGATGQPGAGGQRPPGP